MEGNRKVFAPGEDTHMPLELSIFPKTGRVRDEESGGEGTLAPQGPY